MAKLTKAILDRAIASGQSLNLQILGDNEPLNLVVTDYDRHIVRGNYDENGTVRKGAFHRADLTIIPESKKS